MLQIPSVVPSCSESSKQEFHTDVVDVLETRSRGTTMDCSKNPKHHESVESTQLGSTRRERLKSELYLRLKKRQVVKN